MHLRNAIRSINSDNWIDQVNEILDKAQVSINWYGQRMVTVEGYEGSAQINELVSGLFCTHLEAATIVDPSLSIQKRFGCLNLWVRFEALYAYSDAKLNETRLFKYLTPFIEGSQSYRLSQGDPMAIICKYARVARLICFSFSPERFKQLFPNAAPLVIINGGQIWIPSENSVEEPLAC